MSFGQLWKQASIVEKLILCMYTAGLAATTLDHAADLVQGGLFPYSAWNHAPQWVNVFWTSITVLAPLALVAILVRPFVGFVACGTVVIAEAVTRLFARLTVTLYADLVYWSQTPRQEGGRSFRTWFAVFVLLTLGWMLGRIRRTHAARKRD